MRHGKAANSPMKHSLVSSLLVLSLLVLEVPSLSAADHNVLADSERADGWQLLFDGTTLNGWRGLKATEPGAGWKVIDGAIVRTGKSGDLLTSAEYGDFELSIEWKVADETNSGILYRVGLGESQTYYTGPEYQLLDNIAGGDRFDPKHRAGALYDLVAPPSDVTKPVGVWNETRIIVRGWHIEHWLNGVKIVDVDLASPQGRALVAQSKFHTMAHFATLASGHIALQDHDNMVSFRDIKIRDLQATH
jgi:Domain of Unknown Function (DUF1080)